MTLPCVLAAAALVAVVAGSEYDTRRRKNNDVLAEVDAPEEVAAVVAALRVGNLDAQAALMTPGHPTLAFFDASGDYLTHVALLGGWLRWEGWPSDAPLVDAAALSAWLTAHGCDG